MECSGGGEREGKGEDVWFGGGGGVRRRIRGEG